MFTYIPRIDYMDWLSEFKDKNLIKVLTGLRRSGKSLNRN